MSIYQVHSRKFDQNQFRVLFDWFDFIHRCFFHSRWSCSSQEIMIPALSLHTSIPFHFVQWSLNIQCFVCSKPRTIILCPLIDLGSNHRLTRLHHFITTQIGLASMFQSFVVSILRMTIRNLWEIDYPNWYNRVWFNFQIDICFTGSFNSLAMIESSLSGEWTGL